ncbi:MAG: phenylalanine--tRNA ligase subunit beta [Sphingomonadales bacterium]|nr:phenylalanine--tRNA ligase subunit beta [Sphingomonadales bacterium]
MLLSYSWLCEFLPEPIPIDELCGLLTDLGLEVDAVRNIGHRPEPVPGLVLGKVVKVTPHPKADRLRIALVDVGEVEPRQIVCGAPNLALHQLVVVALPGMTLHRDGDNPLLVQSATLRGVESHGMLCSVHEAGLGDDASGIMVLDDKEVAYPLGTPISKLLFPGQHGEWQIEVSLTPNRSDAMSHFGAARDVAARLRLSLSTPQRESLSTPKNLQPTQDVHASQTVQAAPTVQVFIDDPDGCSHFAGCVVRSLRIGPSPAWMQERLKLCGARPVNLIVDVTNYIQYELGQPMHAYDLRQIMGGEVRVRTAHTGEHITLLNQKEYALQPHHLLITHAHEPMGVAGVMGGLNDSIAADTTDIFLESAHFNARSIRRTAYELGIKSDASWRFERGTDPDGVRTALERAVYLLESCGGGQSEGMVEALGTAVPHASIHLQYHTLDSMAGYKIPRNEVRGILERLDFQIGYEHAGGMELIAPRYRTDVTREVDVLEEILRVYGLNRLPSPPQLRYAPSAPKPGNNTYGLRDSVARMLADSGFHETISLSFISDAELELLPAYKSYALRVLNPVNELYPILRPSLLFSCLNNARHNHNRQQHNPIFFEWGKTYLITQNTRTETDQLALLMSGSATPESWYSESRKVDLPLLHAHVQRIFQSCGIEPQQPELGTHPCFTHRQLQYTWQGRPFAYLGEVDPAITRHYDLRQPVWFATLEWASLMGQVGERKHLREWSRFPPVRRDLALLVNRSVRYSTLRDLALKTAAPLLREVNLFDRYEGDRIAPELRSYALSFLFRDDLATLTDERVEAAMTQIIAIFAAATGAEVRR